MTAESYVNGIVKKIRCGGKRKREIRKQLLAEVRLRMEQGYSLQKVIGEMGSVKEIADSFNENIPDGDRKRYTKTRLLMLLLPIVLVLLALIGAGYWFMPKVTDIGQSRYFQQETVERKMQDTVTLFNAGDYDALQTEAVPELQPYLTAEALENAKQQTAAEWGEFQQFGAVYMQELTQGNRHYAVGEITAHYERVNVIFRLTYDETMKLTGLYMR